MPDIHVRLKDGSLKAIPAGQNAMDLASGLSSQLAKNTVVALVNEKPFDVRDPLPDGATVELLGPETEAGMDTLRHSCEHIMAAAVCKLFPNAQVTMGPKEHHDEFYYDFDIGRSFTDEDLLAIEKEMAHLIKNKVPFEKEWLTKDQAKSLFIKLGQRYKPEILDWIPSETVSIYRCGDFVDLCRGPHLPNAGFIKAFKLLSHSGSYWRGDSSKEVLQRLAGIAFPRESELKDYLFRQEEAKKRDHRKLGPALGLFFVSERFENRRPESKPSLEARLLIFVAEGSPKVHEALATAEEILAVLAKEAQGLSFSCRAFDLRFVKEEMAEPFRIECRLFSTAQEKDLRHPLASALSEIEKKSKAKIQLILDTQATEEIGPGLVMWLPKGGKLRHFIEDFSKRKHLEFGYELVNSPHIAKNDLWRISGHLGFYSESMFAPMNVDGHEYLLKPMNCPFHVLMYKFKPLSYRDLPIRLAEFGTVYRYELAGVLHGLMRVRGFTQDDAHIFCRWDQLDSELDRVIRFVVAMLKAFGFTDFLVHISTRPEHYVGKPEDWVRAEKLLIEAVQRSHLDYVIDEGGGAFYGPKIDIKLKDSLNRLWQCSTLQLDFNNPERFDLSFINDQGQKEQPVMLHRALFGSLERFIGILIEHYAGAFPPWLCPEQVRVLCVSEKYSDYGREITAFLHKHGLRATFCEDQEKLGAKIRHAQLDKVPIMLVIGDQEVQAQGATIRLRSGEDLGLMDQQKLLERLKKICAEPDFSNS